jgi:hypothetical protein
MQQAQMMKASTVSVIIALVAGLNVPWLHAQVSGGPVLPLAFKLTDSNGVPVSGNTSLAARVYDEPAGGTPLWTEIHDPVEVRNGVVSINLGSRSGFGAFELNDELWLGLAIGGDAEMTPRIRIPAQSMPPAGTIVAFGGELGGDTDKVPKGWLLCDGRELPKADFPRLSRVIGTAWGSSAGETFRVPDLRGLFLRGVDGTANRDPDKASRTAIAPGGNPGAAVGSFQADKWKSHRHLFGSEGGLPYTRLTTWPSNPRHSGDPAGGDFETKDNPSDPGGSETRPKNAYVNYIIKY